MNSVPKSNQYDAIVVGAGLAGLVAAYEITKAGKKVLLLDQEPEQNIGGQAFWSLGGLFLVNSPEQRRMGIKDSYELALQDWMGTAGFDRKEDHWPKQWAEAYVKWATYEMRDYIRRVGIRFFPVVGWAERGGYDAQGPGNSVPRFHIVWGTGPGTVMPYAQKAYEAKKKGLLEMKFRHRVTDLVLDGNKVLGVKGEILEPSDKLRGQETSRQVVGDFEIEGPNIVISSGGIGGNFELVRKNWPKRLGKPPKKMVCGVPAHVDGMMLQSVEKAGVNIINPDRMWHYTEGLENWDPIWPNHGIRILPGPSSIWLDAEGNRFPAPYLPGFDTLGTLEHILKTGYEYSWFILNQKIIKKEFALSGSEQNPDLTGRKIKLLLQRPFGNNATGPVEAFKKHGVDFIVEQDLQALVKRMNKLVKKDLLDYEKIKGVIEARDREIDNKFSKDAQIMAIRNARKYLGDRLIRSAKVHKILDTNAGPLIAVRLNLLTRKTLGGIETNLDSQAFNKKGKLVEGLYAAGEAAGFGGGGYHGYRSLEGTFLGGCIFSGMKAGKSIAGKKLKY
ncbi:MAG: FAD-binding dehydrogenase [Cyclobacteriaceae bacterium]